MSHKEKAQRRWYAEDLKLQAPVRRNMAIVEAFAAVPRERFLGPGPWRILAGRRIADTHGYVLTPDDDPRWLYHDVLVAIDPARGLNNGQPSFWACNFDHLRLRRGQRILQVGAGTGYYTAVLAEIVGPRGHVTAVEYDEELAAKARTNLSPWPQVEVVHGDGRTHDPGEVDVIIVFAGSTHPAPLWLDRLAPGGELLMPLTGDKGWGFLLLVTRPSLEDTASVILPAAPPFHEAASVILPAAPPFHEAASVVLPASPPFHEIAASAVLPAAPPFHEAAGGVLPASPPFHDDAANIDLPAARDDNRFDARTIGGVGIFPCIGGRDEEAAGRLRDALNELRRSASVDIPITALHRGDPGPEAMEGVWYRGPGFWLERAT
jgi:protein-L-isoaspartate(D-aspartate) O-methyltransferase